MSPVRATVVPPLKVHNPASRVAGRLRDPAEFGAAKLARERMLALERNEQKIPLDDSSTLTEFFDRWYKPVVLVAQERSPGTIENYETSLQLWSLLTCDPALRDIDDALLAAFAEALKSSGYKKGPEKERRSYSTITIREHLNRISAMLGRASRFPARGGPSARLLESHPSIPLIRATGKKKPPFTLDEARRIAAACHLMTKPSMPDRPLCITPAKWWRAFIGLMFYTGLRLGTILQLRWRDVEYDHGQLYLNVSAGITKTRKAGRVAVHSQLATVLKLRAGVNSGHRIVPLPCHRRTLLDFHRELQRLAGLPRSNWLSPHAWRRTHGQLLGELGLAGAEQLASGSLQHGSVAVTKASYIDLVDRFRLQMPPLWPHGVSDEQQLSLWE